MRDEGQWDPKNQRPELWNLSTAACEPGERVRVFPLSNWTELDVWQYIHLERFPVVPLYFAKDREVVVRGNVAASARAAVRPAAARREAAAGDVPHALAGLLPCTGAIRSDADTVPKIIDEVIAARRSERAEPHHRSRPGRLDGMKKREGYF